MLNSHYFKRSNNRTNRNLSSNQLQKFSIIHLLVCQIYSVIKESIRCDRCGCVLRLFFIFDVYRFERDIMLFCSLFQDRNIFCVKGTLACIVKHISFFFDTRILGAIFETGFCGRSGKRQICKLNSVISLIANGKTFVFQIFRICKKRFFFFRKLKCKDRFSPWLYCLLYTRLKVRLNIHAL